MSQDAPDLPHGNLPTRLLLSWFGCGFAPKAPGTVGTLGALPFAWVVHASFGPVGLLGFALVITIVGWAVAHRYLGGDDRDPSWIVIDEVAGVGLALAAAPLSLGWFAVGFGLFRLFDIVKPWPVSWADQKVGGAAGVMLDDILAGLYAAVIILIARAALGDGATLFGLS
jgi:phosphatidylglycerophosphatase A